MNIDLLIKCFISFCIGAIVYKFISDRCSCNIVEGQTDPESGVPESDAGAGSGAAAALEDTAPDPDANLMDNIPIDNIQQFIGNINDNI